MRVRRKLFLEATPLEGEVLLTFFSKGKILDVWDLGKNIIVTQGRANMAHCLAGDDVGNRKVVSLSLGDAGHIPESPTQAKVVSVGDTALFGSEIINKPVSFDYPDGEGANKVRFSATISESEANGSGSQAVSEAALYDNLGRMMTHKAFGLITKTADFGLLIQWTILF